MNNVWSTDDREMIDKGNELILLNLGYKHYDYSKKYPHTIIVHRGAYGWTNGNIDHVYNKIESYKGNHWYRHIEDAKFHLYWDMLIPAVSTLVDKFNLDRDELYNGIITNNKKDVWKYLVNNLQNGNRYHTK